MQRGPSLDALGSHGRHGRESESAKGDGLTRHAAVRSSAVFGTAGKHGGDAAGRCAEVLTTATLPPVAGDAAQMRHRKVFASTLTLTPNPTPNPDLYPLPLTLTPKALT